MSHQCPFPVHSTDNRRCYRTGSAPGFILCLAAVAALLCYAGFSHAAPIVPPHTIVAAASGSAPVFSHSNTPIAGD